MIKIYHSPDTDDLLLFWKLIEAKDETGQKIFECRSFDTEKLNQLAISGEPDICAVSAAVIPQLKGRYMLSPYGASIGRGFGPVVVSKKLSTIDGLQTARVGIPGDTTTAALVFSKLAPKAQRVTIPILPFEKVFTAIDTGEIDAAVLIHEGQLAYERFGCRRITDLGSWWREKTSLPLPLGVNVVRIFEDEERTKQLSSALKESVDYGLDNASTILKAILERDQTLKAKLESEAAFQNYLAMYANEDSRTLKEDVYASLEILLGDSFA